ncbi:MAG TPA: histidine kinase N-terminal domain-containing protein, partial [Actinomycetota bacterium]|nr:histidine kinase N-terminal domain-containing protein [Actinomycetota bacterium]
MATTFTSVGGRSGEPLLLGSLCSRAGSISTAEMEHLHRLVAVWQLLADLSFADLLLLAPMRRQPDRDLLVLAQTRPDTAQTLYPEDHVGTALLRENASEAQLALETGQPHRGAADERGVQRVAVPVRVEDRVPAVLFSEGIPYGGRRVSGVEEAYSRAADSLYSMILEGVFPFPGMQD